MGKVTVSYLDYSNEVSRTSFNVDDPTGGAFDWTTFAAGINSLVSAINAVTDCNELVTSLSVDIDVNTPGTPNIGSAQRETGVRIFYQDTVNGKKYTMTVPGPQLDILTQGSDDIDITAGDMAALVTAFEAGAVSELGNPVIVLSAKYIGRRN